MVKTVSIIIINYNGAEHLKDCLMSLTELDYPSEKYEVIVFDNGSVDDSVLLAAKYYPSATILKHSKNLGFAAPHRVAAEAASGEVLAFLNNDMKVASDWLKNGIAHLDRSQGVVCASSKIMTWNGKHIDFAGGSLQYLGYADQVRNEDVKNGEAMLFPCGGAMFICRDVFLQAGCFDDDYFAIFEDVDLGWRLWLMGYTVVFAADSITYHKGHGTLDSQRQAKKRFLMHRNAMMTIIKNYDDDNLKRILPLALVLAVKRALLFMNIRKQSFYFWEEETESEVAGSPDYEEGCIQLAALDDVFSSFADLMEKRKVIQGMRKRADSEIFPLFKDPFRNLMGYVEYLWDEVDLFGHLSLDRIFDCSGDYLERVNDGIYHAEKTLKDLKRQIQQQSAGSRLNISDKPQIRHLAGRFSKSLKDNGWAPTLDKVLSHLAVRVKK